MEVKTIFLHGDLEEHVYMEQPERLTIRDVSIIVVLMLRVLLTVFLYIVMQLFIDDMLIATNNLCNVNELKILLGKEFDMKNLGVAKKILGMDIHGDKSLLSLTI
ncbi:hypothetical protein CR513_20434, partial [Mucuna pruriens]